MAYFLKNDGGFLSHFFIVALLLLAGFGPLCSLKASSSEVKTAKLAEVAVYSIPPLKSSLRNILEVGEAENQMYRPMKIGFRLRVLTMFISAKSRPYLPGGRWCFESDLTFRKHFRVSCQ